MAITLKKPGSKRQSIYISLIDKRNGETRTKSLTVYGTTLEKCVKVVRDAFEREEKSDATK